MIHLQQRGIELLGVSSNEQAQRERYLRLGWEKAEALNVLQVYEQWLTDDEKKRVAKVELLDELEEWRLLMQHYCLSYGLKGRCLDVYESVSIPLLSGSK